MGKEEGQVTRPDWFKASRVIRMRMVELGVGRNELARRIGVLPQRINALLEQEDMTLSVFRRVLRALGMDIDLVELANWSNDDERRRAARATEESARIRAEVRSGTGDHR
jgi:plasmid maintenance system antidote protein VapI